MTIEAMSTRKMKSATAEELNRRRNILEDKVNKVRAQYRLAADREVATDLQEIKYIDYEFHRRSWCP